MADSAVAHALRRCTRCGEEKIATLEHFPPHKIGKHGLHSRCRPCKRLDDTERRNRPDQVERQKKWRDANKAKVRAYNEQYRENGYSSTAHVAEWREKNLEHARAYVREANRRRRRENPAYLLKCRITSRLNLMIKGKGGRRTEELLGYTMEQLRQHIERQFTKSMSWEKVGRGQIEIDHIIPVKAFNITSIDDPDFKVCWALANLRPLWAEENRRKNGRRTHLL